MTAPEPLDEHPAGPVEIRGGDRDEDFMPAFAQGGQLPGVPAAFPDDFDDDFGDAVQADLDAYDEDPE